MIKSGGGRYSGLDPYPIAPYVRRATKEMGQRKFAQLIGVSQSAVSLWVQEKRCISLNNADKLAGFFGFHPLELWEATDYEQARG